MSQVLDVAVADGVATLTMNRPAARNALGDELKAAFAEAVPRVAADVAVRAVVLTGGGGHFCAGGDLRSMMEVRSSMDAAGWRARMQTLHPWVRQLLEMEKPLIAAVDGYAYGGGFSLALLADFVLATPEARFCLSFLRVGLMPDYAAMYTLPRAVGVQRARELMLSAREVGADEALRLGIAMELHPREALLPRAHAMAASFAGASPLAVGLIKREVGMALATGLDAALQHEADHQPLCFMSPEHEQAVQAFLDKQPAPFQFPRMKS